jgi:hypothetical protein
MTDPLLLPAENPGIIAASGPDAIRFINGQITQDARDLADLCLPACITDAKGRLQYWIEIQQGSDQDQVWLITRHDQTTEILARLDRYLIADDLTLTEFTGWKRVRSSSPVCFADITRRSSLWFDSGFDLWWRDLPGDLPPAMGLVDREDLRIARGIPAWDQELQPDMLPPEAGLDRHSISYHKGCYVGQEVLSRMKSAGKTNRKLARFQITPPLPHLVPLGGIPLILGGKECGTLTSSSSSGTSALGYLGKSAFDAASLEVSGNPGIVAHRTGWV